MATNEVSVVVDGQPAISHSGEPLIALLRRQRVAPPHVCYHPSLGTLQTCDTCLVEVNGELVRACATPAASGQTIITTSARARAAQTEATQRLLRVHDLYCSVCENNNGDCALHNAVGQLNITHQRYPFTAKPYAVDDSNPFYQYDPSQCILCGRCVEVCQDVQVNETLRINWELPVPRVIWDEDAPINLSSCVSCGQCVTVCPVNALMEKSMLGEAGFMTGIPGETKRQLIELTKAVEPSFTPIVALSNAEAALRASQIKKTKTVCTYCGVGCSFEIWTKGRRSSRSSPATSRPPTGSPPASKASLAGTTSIAPTGSPPHSSAKATPSARRAGRRRWPLSRSASAPSGRLPDPTRSPSSAPPSVRTRSRTSRRSSPARSSARTTSTTARATASRPPRWASGAPSATVATRVPSVTWSRQDWS